MYLKRIELFGFKSFADKTVIEFTPGITAVVGPNGSGKSNIADAIRWVLGEQSARMLRGAKMEDVIFAGSETRRAVNFCEVSLVLDNTDRHLPVVYDEVMVTRRVYRSGESEYLINRQACRLKDITELFMDSGLGREAYSIVGQGRIEEMLSTRPEDRRGPFEDAAGIVKFKHRRREAERKLEDTEANLVRVDDVIAELEGQAEPLAAEAERAEQWKRLDADRQRLELSLWVRQIDELKERLSSAEREVAQREAVRDAALARLSEAETRYREARSLLDSQQQALDTTQREYVAAVEERERNEGQRGVLVERLRHATQTLGERQQARAQAEADMASLEQAVLEAEQRHAELSARAQIKQREAEAAAAAWHPDERARLEGEVERLSGAVIDAHGQVSACRNELASSRRHQEQDEQRRARLAQERWRWQSVLTETSERVNTLTQQAHQLQDQAAEVDAAIAQWQARLRDLATEEAQAAEQAEAAKQEMASLASRLELLRELNDGYDGYQQGVRAVLTAAQRGQLRGIRGALAALIEVPQTYELAVETALGPALQHIVADTEADARRAIEYLKQRKAGRATLMPLDVIRPRRLAPGDLQKAKAEPGWVGIAADLVHCDPAHRPAVEHLLGNVVVARSLVDATAIARRLDYRVRIVTLEGDVVNPGGVMSGGHHSRRGPGLLGRRREQRDVEAAMAACRSGLEAVQRRKDELRARIDAVTGEIRALQSRRDECLQAVARLAAESRELQAQVRHAEERVAAVDWELAEMAAEDAAAQQRAEEARHRLEQAEAEAARLEQALAEARKRLSAWHEARQAAQATWTGLRVEAATLSQQAEAERDRLRGLAERREQLQRQIHAWAKEMEALETEIEQTRADLARVEAALKQLGARAESLDRRQAELREARLAAEAAVAEAEETLSRARTEAQAAEDALRRARSGADRADLELQHALQRLGEKYRMTYEWAKAHVEPVDDAEAARRRVAVLEAQMRELGEVRLGAIEEWERLRERLDFLRRERADLEAARARLDEVIREIDEEMARRFQQTFEEIRTQFQEMFRTLFGGGRADLTLTDPSEPLQSGIEVMAQPPGKKLQNLNLLSGGERALTAMALLFAILRVRPVPFCVLDEVEAALDEANVARFAQQLRRFAQDTQFVVITHRRGTMEEADALYGVTMQDSGVSSLISVRLEEVENDFESA